MSHQIITADTRDWKELGEQPWLVVPSIFTVGYCLDPGGFLLWRWGKKNNEQTRKAFWSGVVKEQVVLPFL